MRHNQDNTSAVFPLETAACAICGSNDCIPVAELSFALRGGAVPSLVSRCCRCGSYARHFSAPLDLGEHWDIRSYTSPRHEERFRRARQSFFEWLANWALGELPRGLRRPRVLDVGCSYGHLLEIFHRRGCECFGVEPVDRLRNGLNREGQFTVYPSMDEVPNRDASYDVVTLVDSLYYFQDPLTGLKKAAERLRDTGVMVIRVTNRTPLLDAWRGLGRGITDELFGDQLFALSHPGMATMLRQSGLSLENLRFFEHKPLTGRGLAGFVYYGLMPAFCAVTRLKLTPGLTYLCKREPQASAAQAAARGKYDFQVA